MLQQGEIYNTFLSALELKKWKLYVCSDQRWKPFMESYQRWKFDALWTMTGTLYGQLCKDGQLSRMGILYGKLTTMEALWTRMGTLVGQLSRIENIYGQVSTLDGSSL